MTTIFTNGYWITITHIRPTVFIAIILNMLIYSLLQSLMSSCLNLLLIKEVGFCSPSKDLGIFILIDMEQQYCQQNIGKSFAICQSLIDMIYRRHIEY